MKPGRAIGSLRERLLETTREIELLLLETSKGE